jgi:hypothetical protein
MKTSVTTVIGALVVCLGFVISSPATAQPSQDSPISRDQAVSILQNAPGGENLIFATGDDRWRARTSEMSSGAVVYAVDVEGTKVYVGGTFESILGLTMNNIAMYDLESEEWTPLSYSGSVGVSGTVYAIDALGDDVFIGGTFTNTASGDINYIARWNTDYFYPLTYGDDSVNGVGGNVWTITAVAADPAKGIAETDNGGPYYDVYVGGEFTSAGGESANKIAVYKNYHNLGWEQIDPSINPDGNVYDIHYLVEGIIFGGSFNSIGDVGTSKVAGWLFYETPSLYKLGGGVNGTVYAIDFVDNGIYVGGDFSQAYNNNPTAISANRLARYATDTNEWSSTGSNFDNSVYSLYMDGTDLYVGGSFGRVTDEVYASGVAIYNTSTQEWSRMGSGLTNSPFNSVVWDLAKFSGELNSSTQNQLFTVGDFNTAGGNDADNVASWDATSYIPDVITLQEPSDEARNISVTPTLSWDRDELANTYELEISLSSSFSSVLYSETGITFDAGKVTEVLTPAPSVYHTVDEALDYNTTYYWRVRGVGDDGNGEWSSTWSFTTIPGPVTKISPASGSSSQPVPPEFTWEPINGYLAYQLRVSENANLSSPVINRIITTGELKSLSDIASTSYTYTPVVDEVFNHNTEYYWDVRVVADTETDPRIYGASGDTISFLTKLQQVTINAPGDGQNNQDVLPTFQITTVNGATQYRLQISTDNTFPEAGTTEIVIDDLPQKGAEINAGFFEYNLEEQYELENDTQYYWRVRGERAQDPTKTATFFETTIVNTGDYSDTWSFRTKWPIPAQVTLLSPEDDATGLPVRPTFTWDSMEYTSRYRLEIFNNSELSGDPVYENDQIWDPNSDAKTVGDVEISNGAETTVEFTLPEGEELDNATTYYWHVSGINSQGEGEFSDSRSFTTIWATPGTATLVSPIDGIANQSLTPTLTWEEASDANQYDLEVSMSSDFTDRDAVVHSPTGLGQRKVAGVSTIDEFTYDIPADILDYATTYFWRVRATNPDFEGEWSDAEDFRTLRPVPGVTTLVSPASEATGVSIQPTFTWEPVEHGVYYDLQVWVDPELSGDPTYESLDIPGLYGKSVGDEVADVAEIEHTITIELQNRLQYYWRVRAKNSTGTGEWTELRQFRTIWPEPGVVTRLAPEDLSADQPIRPSLSWVPLNTARNFDVQISRTMEFADGDIVYEREGLVNLAKSTAETDAVAIEHEVEEDLEYYTTYYWRVRATNPDFTGNYSDEPWSFTTIWPAPGQVTNLTYPADGLTGVNLRPTFAWTNISFAQSYDLQVWDNESMTGEIVYTADGITTDVPKSGGAEISNGIEVVHLMTQELENGTQYFWRVRAVNETGEGTWSALSDFTTIVAVPDQVTLVSPADEATGVSVLPTLEWNAAARAASYRVQVSESPSFDSFELNSDGHVDTDLTLEGALHNATTYYWRVQATNAGGDGGWSATRSFTTIVAVPDQVTLVSPADEAVDVVKRPTLSWNPAARVVSYYVQVSTVSDFTSTVVNQTAVVGESYALESDLLANTTYYWRVRADNNGGNGAWSATWSFTTAEDLPAQVGLLYPNNTQTGIALRPEFKWSEAERAVAYELEVSKNEDYSDQVIQRNTGADLTFTPAADLEGLTTYWYRVRGLNAENTAGPWSAPRSFVTQTDLPGTVALSAPNDGATAVALMPEFSWQAATRAQSYRIQVSTDMNFGEGSTTTVQGLQATTLDWATKLTGSTTYYWRVQGVNAQGAGPWSERSFTTDLDVPGKVFLRFPNNNTTGVSLTPEFTWSVVQGATGYQIQVSRNQNFGTSVIDKEDITQPAGNVDIVKVGFDQGNLRASTSYFYRVRAKNSKGYGEWSDTRTFTTKEAEIAGKVQDIRVRQITTKQIVNGGHTVQNTAAFEISWTPPAFDGGTEIVDYRIVYRTTDETSWTTYERPASTDTVAVVTGFESGVAYAFDVLAVNAVGAPEPTDDPPVVVSIEVEEIPDQVTLMQNYPNPFNPSTTIRFALPVTGEVRLEVYSMLGQRLSVLVSGQQPAGWHTVQFDASNWASGTYIYRLQADGFTQTKKFLLVK